MNPTSAKPRPVRVVLTNTVTLNGGEAATVHAVIALLRAAFGPDTAIAIFDQTPASAARHHPGLDFHLLLWNRASWQGRPPGGRLRRRLARLTGRLARLRFGLGLACWQRGPRWLATLLLSRPERADVACYAAADLVVSSGGTYLVDNYDIAPRVFDFELAHRLGRPLVLFTQSMGPFRADATRPRLRDALARARLILLRDEPSLTHLRSLGVQGPDVRIAADAVFALVGADEIAARYRAPKPVRTAPRVAVSVRHWHYFRRHDRDTGMARYRTAVAAAVTALVRDHGAQVVFVSTCQGIPEYWFDDARIANEVVATLPADVRSGTSVDRAFHPPQAMLELLGGFDLVLATRFHMTVLALLAATPVLSIAYEFKGTELHRQLGLDDQVVDIEDIDAGTFPALADRCLRRRDAIRAAQAPGVLAEHSRAAAVVPWLRAQLPAERR